MGVITLMLSNTKSGATATMNTPLNFPEIQKKTKKLCVCCIEQYTHGWKIEKKSTLRSFEIYKKRKKNDLYFSNFQH